MIGYTLRRLLLLVPIFFAVSVVIFAIIHIKRVAFDQIHVFTLHPEAAIAFANAFGAQSEFDWTRHALIPGDPVDSLLKVGSGPEQRAIIEARYGLDRPLPVQYFIWLRKVLTCDLGTAIVGKRPVIDLVLQALPYSLALAD